jgi:hypothetical protein
MHAAAHRPLFCLFNHACKPALVAIRPRLDIIMNSIVVAQLALLSILPVATMHTSPGQAHRWRHQHMRTSRCVPFRSIALRTAPHS